jgi:hypothetical protein
MSHADTSAGATATDPCEILRQKTEMFRRGDPDRAEFSEFTDFAILQCPGRSPECGFVRILCHVQTRQCRLLMRNAACTATLLNHFLLPGVALFVQESSVSYTVHDHADPAKSDLLRVQLTFEGVIAREYFRTKFELGVRVNRLLLAHGLSAVTVLQQTVDASAAPPAMANRRQFAPDDPLEGIIAHLTRECGGNVDDCGIVAVTSSTRYNIGRDFGAKLIADLRAASGFCSSYRSRDVDIPHVRNHWVCYDFKDRRVIPTHYTIRSWHDSWADGNHIKSWLVEVSLDGATWVEIDHREDNHILNEKDVARTFEVWRSQECRFIKLVNIGATHYGAEVLLVSAFEIFGTLIE